MVRNRGVSPPGLKPWPLYWLCDLRNYIEPLCASRSLSINLGILVLQKALVSKSLVRIDELIMPKALQNTWT